MDLTMASWGEAVVTCVGGGSSERAVSRRSLAILAR